MAMSSEVSEVNDSSAAGLAVTRDRRANAGARMSKLLQAEDEDEFYQTTYGGFAEVRSYLFRAYIVYIIFNYLSFLYFSYVFIISRYFGVY